MKSKKLKAQKGFTLIEIIVAISVFTFIMFISTGSILSILDANRKSQNTRTVLDNLNYSVEAMTRSIRFGSNYHCDISTGSISSVRDCTTGGSSIAVLDSNGARVIYRLNNGAIEKSANSGASYSKLTSADVTITNITFYVIGSTPYSSESSHYQPRVIIVISGFAGVKASSKTSFTIETTVSQRMIDSQ